MTTNKPVDKLINQIVQGDCIEIMRQIPDETVDVTFADPPFNLKKLYSNYNDKKSAEEYLAWCKDWITEMVRITKPTGSIFIHNIPKWLTYFVGYLNDIAIFRHWIAWDAMGSPLGKTLLPNHYGILYYVKSKDYKFNDIRSLHKRCRKCGLILKDYGGKKDQLHQFGAIISDVWTDLHRIRHKTRRDEHPCQLPVPLLERLLLMSTDEGDVVLDPFMGTGTTAIAAKKLGRQYIGIDIDHKYVEITKDKLINTKETKLGDSYVSIYLNKVATIRDKDWDNIKDYFEIADEPLELEKTAIKLLTETEKTQAPLLVSEKRHHYSAGK